MAEYIEGKRAVLEAFKVGVPAKCLYVADGMHGDKNVSELTKRAHKMGLSVKQVKRAEMDKRSERGSHQGIMLETRPFEYASGQDIIDAALVQASEQNGDALIVVLDHITDAGNLGAIARSAEVVGAAGLVIPNKRSARVTAATYKSSAGAVSHIPIAQVANIAQFIDRLKTNDFWVAGASEKASQCIWEAPMAGKLALVMGNEGAGLARLTQEHCDFLVSLPQAGNIGSLNVAQAATACMYEWMRQTRMNAQ
jgi:23S rRNA (guanosine2251-2'-O)-methyltransferase